MSAEPADPREDPLELLLLEWEDRREGGQDVSAEELCGDRSDLVEPLRKKIAALKALGPLLSTRLSVPTAPHPRVAQAQKAPSVPGYEVLEELGRGGMGVVFKARHLALKRLVALKTIRAPGQAGSEQLARFRIEAEAVARLRHPNIVQIYDVGESEGAPYFALEFMEGGTLDRRLGGKPVAPRLAAECVETLAHAIHFAHEQGIVHRDLKPGNVLLDASEGATSDAGEAVRFSPTSAKIADFGLAKFFAETDSNQTSTGAILGTPSYMAPEQASGQSREIGPATDVYALGAILYELLTGRAPFRAESTWDTIAQVVGQEPIPPSKFQPRLPRDLETICLRCLEKKPAQRFSSAKALAEDLRRYLEGLPILAKPQGPGQRLVKWTRRRPALAALIAAIVIGSASLLVLGILWSLDLQSANKKIRDERDLTKKAEAKEKEEHAKARRSLYDLQLAFVKMVHEKEPSRGLALLDDTERCPEELRDFSWKMFRKICKRDRILMTLPKDAKTLAFVDSGNSLLAADTHGTAELLIALNGKEPDAKRMQKPMHFVAAADGEVIFGASSDGDLSRIPNPKSDQVVPFGKHSSIAALECSGDGTMLAAATRDGEVVAYSISTAKPVWTQKGLGAIAGIALPRDGKFIAIACDAGIRLFDLPSGKERPAPKMRSGILMAVALSPDGKRLIACNADGVTQWWDTESLQSLGRFDAMLMIPTALASAPNGRSIAISSMDGVIRQIDLESQRETMILTGHAGAVWRLQYAPDGRTIASAGADRTVRQWTLDPPIRGKLLECKSYCLSAAFAGDDASLVVGTRNGRISRWDLASGNMISAAETKYGSVSCLRVLPRGLIASGHGRGMLSLRVAEGTEESASVKAHTGPILTLAASPSGDRLLTAGQDGFVRCWECPSLQEKWSKPFDDVLWSLDVGPEGNKFAVGGGSGQVWICGVDGSVESVLPKRKSGVYAVAFSPDGKTLAVAGLDQAIELWDWPSRTILLSLTAPRVKVRSIAFPPDGRTLASVGDDGEVRLWDLVTGQERLRLPLPTLGGNGVVFAPDGRSLAAFGDTKIVLWRP